jgi:hypothetical protein
MSYSNQQPITIPVVQVRPNMIMIYPYTLWPSGYAPGRRESAFGSYDNDQSVSNDLFEGKTAYSGQLTSHSRKRLQKCINLLVAIAKPKRVAPPIVTKAFTFSVNFITLTLPAAQGSVTDKELKKGCLDPWIKSMKRKHQMKSYVWRAERQFNGNVHFHIISDAYLPQDDVRNDWNRQLSKFHFIDKFAEKHNYKTPNSTDVHAIHKIDNLAAYMVKYMSKDSSTHLTELNAKLQQQGKEPIQPEKHDFRKVIDQPKWDTPINGKVWDCSENLKAKDRCEVEADSSIRQEVNEIVHEKKLRFINTEHCTIIFSGKSKMQSLLKGELLKLYLSYLHRISNYDQLKIERKAADLEVLRLEALIPKAVPDIIPFVPFQMQVFQSA